MLVDKPDNLSSIPVTSMVEGQKDPQQFDLHIPILYNIYTWTHTHTQREGGEWGSKAEMKKVVG